MKSEKLVLFMFVATLSGGLQGCGDDDVCTGDPCECEGICPDGGDADADGDTPVQYGSLTVTATAAGVEVNADINLDGSPTDFQTPHTFDSLPVGTHSILLSYTGRLQAPSPTEVTITTAGTNVNIALYRDQAGRWREETYGYEDNYWMEITPPDYRCPETWVRILNVNPIGTLCVEANDSLSLCKTRASECEGLWAEGRILSDGQRMEATLHDPMVGTPENYIYIRLP